MLTILWAKASSSAMVAERTVTQAFFHLNGLGASLFTTLIGLKRMDIPLNFLPLLGGVPLLEAKEWLLSTFMGVKERPNHSLLGSGLYSRRKNAEHSFLSGNAEKSALKTE